MIKRYVGYAAISSILFILIACGGGLPIGDDGAPAPETSTITISPSSKEYSCGAGAAEIVPNPFDSFLIKVTDTRTGVGIGNVELTISYPWAQPNLDRVQLYDGGVPVNSPMTATTDENGTYTLYYRYKICGGYAYFGDVEVTSGTRYASATLDVSVSSE